MRGGFSILAQSKIDQRGNIAKFIGNNRGQNMVEFALVLPILLLLVLGIIDFGQIFSQQLIVNAASREAVRKTVASGSRVAGIAEGAKFGTFTITMNDPTKLAIGDDVTATVSTPVKIIDPVLSKLYGATYTVSTTTNMRLEVVGIN